MHHALPVLLVLLSACGEPEETVISEMERALYASQAGIAAQLLATEVLAHTFDEPDSQLRHGTTCGCPCTERIGDSAPFVLTLDYDLAGCLPETGLVPTTLAGHAVLEWDGTVTQVTLDDFHVGLKHTLTGTLSGVPSADGSEITLEADLEVGDWTAILDSTTRIDETTGIVIDGSSSVAGPYDADLDLKGVALGWNDIPPPCPAPSDGELTVAGDKHDVEIAYAKPGDGFVTVTRDTRVSESVDYCGYRTDLF